MPTPAAVVYSTSDGCVRARFHTAQPMNSLAFCNIGDMLLLVAGTTTQTSLKKYGAGVYNDTLPGFAAMICDAYKGPKPKGTLSV